MPLDWEIYKTDEKQAVLNYQFTTEQRVIAQKYKDDFVNNRHPHLVSFLKAINEYGPSCLDVGCAFGAQYFALKANYPNVIWTGMEVSNSYRLETDDELEKSGALATVIPITDYKEMTLLPDNSFDCVTSRSFLRHYAFENATVIIDEMLRICRKAVIIMMNVPYDPDLELMDKDLLRYTERFGPWAGTGFTVEWPRADWLNYLKGKDYIEYETPLCIVIRKPQVVKG